MPRPTTGTSEGNDVPAIGAQPRVVALGGGHGLYAALSALRRVTSDLTAIVTVADNGGSSGRLRSEFGVLPPGDLRMALAALCDEDEWGSTWAATLQHRFQGSGEMRGHAVGNLLIVALWELLGDPVAALEWVGRLLGANGRVLPMAMNPLDITAEVEGLDAADPLARRTVRGQVEVATTEGRIVSIRLQPEPVACPQAVAAIRAADWVVVGPGSWYTSVIPHLMVPELARALDETRSRLIVVLNLAPQVGETHGFSPADHLRVLREHAPGIRIDTVVADRRRVPDRDALQEAVGRDGSRLILADIAASDGTPRHVPSRLADVLSRLVAEPLPAPGD